jgi:hypothetical protein
VAFRDSGGGVDEDIRAKQGAARDHGETHGRPEHFHPHTSFVDPEPAPCRLVRHPGARISRSANSLINLISAPAGVRDDRPGTHRAAARLPPPRPVVFPTTWLKASEMASTTARGYGHRHEQERKRWARLVESRRVLYARCHRPILPGQPWEAMSMARGRSTRVPSTVSATGRPSGMESSDGGAS